MKKLMLLVALVGASMPAVAQAGTIATGNININNYAGESVTVTRPSGSNIATISGSATAASPTGGLTNYLPGSFVTYCVDLFTNTSSNPYQASLDTMNYWALQNGQPAPGAGQRASWLYQTYATSATTAAQRSGLQLAIWNTLYDSDFDVSSGAFRVVSGATGGTPVANTMLTALQMAVNSNGVGSYNNYWLRLTKNGTETQDFIGPMAVPDGGTTLALLGCALMGLGALRRRLN